MIILIKINKGTKIYENGANGINEISLNINEGEFAFIVGASGSGKSTIIRLILKEVELSQGEIIVNNKNLSELTHKQIPYFRRDIGVVFQDFRLLPNKTVYDNVAFAMQIVEATSRDIRRSVPGVLAMVGLQKKAKAYPGQLSGGEKQRTALARAIINKPRLLIADEPTGNLDPENAWEIMKLLEDINERGTTVIVATHAKEIVDTMKKRVITIKNGVIIQDFAKGGYNDEI
jgi:cell division transport system ATP-binding protein